MLPMLICSRRANSSLTYKPERRAKERAGRLSLLAKQHFDRDRIEDLVQHALLLTVFSGFGRMSAEHAPGQSFRLVGIAMDRAVTKRMAWSWSAR